MLKIDVKDDKAEIRVTGSLGEVMGEFSHVIREVKRSIAEQGKYEDFSFTAAVVTAALDMDEDIAIEAIKEAIAKRAKSKDAEDEDEDEDEDEEDEDEDEDEGEDGVSVDELLSELKKILD